LGGGVQSEMPRTLFLVPFAAVVPRFSFAPFLSPHNALLARLLMALQLPLRLSLSGWRAMFNRTPNSRWGWWKCNSCIHCALFDRRSAPLTSTEVALPDTIRKPRILELRSQLKRRLAVNAPNW